MKVGIEVRIDVKKIDKLKLYKGEKGTYLTMTTFIDTDQKDQYDNNGFISEHASKEEKAQGKQGTILGNCKVFYTDGGQPQQNNQPASKPPGYDDDYGF